MRNQLNGKSEGIGPGLLSQTHFKTVNAFTMGSEKERGKYNELLIDTVMEF